MDSVITKSPYICAPNIMDSPDYVTKQIELDMTGADCIKAGSPISEDGKVSNDEKAVGILLTDCHTCLGAHRGLVVIDGRIKQDVAAEHSGITISDKAKAALVNISFTGDGERMGGSGSGSVTVDSELSDTSENPVQNKVVKAALDVYGQSIDSVFLVTNIDRRVFKIFEWDGVTENRDTFSYNVYRYTKLDELSNEADVQDFLDLINEGSLLYLYSENGKAQKAFYWYFRTDGDEKVFICSGSMAIAKEAGTYTVNNQTVTIPSAGLYVVTGGNKYGFVKSLYLKDEGYDSSGIVIRSSETPDKRFMLTVNDAGTISAMELT